MEIKKVIRKEVTDNFEKGAERRRQGIEVRGIAERKGGEGEGRKEGRMKEQRGGSEEGLRVGKK